MAERRRDEEQPDLQRARGQAPYMTDGGLCLSLCHLGSEYSTAAEEMHHKPQCHVYVQSKEVCHVLFLGGYRQSHQSQLSSQDIWFFSSLSGAFRENVWFDMAFYIVDKTGVSLACFGFVFLLYVLLLLLLYATFYLFFGCRMSILPG